MPASKSQTIADALTTAPARKPLPYVLQGKPAPVAGTEGNVSRGVNVKSGEPHLVFQEGRTQQALSFHAVAAALYHGVITDAEVDAIRKARTR